MSSIYNNKKENYTSVNEKISHRYGVTLGKYFYRLLETFWSAPNERWRTFGKSPKSIGVPVGNNFD
jgi:hypothetical protein